MHIGTNATLVERFTYDRASLTDSEILDALVELESVKEQLEEIEVKPDDYDELQEKIEKLETELEDTRSDLAHVTDELNELKGIES